MNSFFIPFKKYFLFILGGGLNTLLSFGIYLLLTIKLPYLWAYGLAYCIGILFAYFFNTLLVFEGNVNRATFLRYPLLYCIQYLVSALFLFILVEFLRFNEKMAPLMVALMLIPLTYWLNHYFIKGGSS